jgi:hypothetical protein
MANSIHVDLVIGESMLVSVEIPTESIVNDVLSLIPQPEQLPAVDEIVANVLDKLPEIVSPCDVIADSPSSDDDITMLEAAYNKSIAGLQLRPGIYRISRPLRLTRDGVSLHGVSNGERSDSYLGQLSIGTRIEPTDDFVGSALVIVARPTNDRPLAGVTVCDLSIDGRGVGNDIVGLFLQSHRATIKDVNISRCSGHGLVVEGLPTWQTYDNFYARIRSHHNGGDGIRFNANSPDSQATQLMSFHNGGHGVHMLSSSHQIGMAHAYNNGGNGLYLDGYGTRSMIGLVKAEQNGKSGVYLLGPVINAIMSVVRLKNNCQSGFGLYNQLHLSGSVIGTHITTLSIADISGEGASVAQAKYAVSLDSSQVRDTSIVDMRIESNAYSTAELLDAGQRTLIGGVSTNSGNPSNSGNWNGVFREGATVDDVTNKAIYRCIRRKWRKIASYT